MAASPHSGATTFRLSIPSKSLRTLGKTSFSSPQPDKLSPKSLVSQSVGEVTDRSSLYPDWLESRRDFRELRSRYEKLDSLDVFEVCARAGIQRNDFERKAIVRCITKCPFFAPMKVDQLLDLSDRMHSMRFASGETLISKGELADCLFVILTGRVGIYLDEQLIDEATVNNVVGETAIHSRGHRTASVRAHGEVTTLRLTYEDFDNVAFKLKLQDFYNVASFLGSLEYFSEWNRSKLYRLASIVIAKQCLQGQKVFKKGDPAHDLFIVRQGTIHLKVELDLQHTNRWPAGTHQWTCVHTTRRYEKTLKECKTGDFFGERELVDSTPLAATALCTSPTALLFIIRQEFFSEIFSDKDRRMLYNLAENRPMTNQLRFRLEIEKRQEQLKTEAMLNAINTNSLPSGRELFHTQSESRKVEWARRLVTKHKEGVRVGIVKQMKKVQTLPTL